jgi:hypothetical protein
MMDWLKFCRETGNENNVTITVFNLVCNGKDVTITFCGKDAHLWLYDPVMGTHSFIRYIVTVTVTSLVTTFTNEHLQ